MTELKAERTFVATERTFWIAHNPALHYGILDEGEGLTTGQINFETFDRRLPWMSRVVELGGSFA